ncbi:DDE-type integrase/transposase/recombinase [Streptomyces scopuliridis]|uniref:DDE-type integrase/transposase/recombinase n=1 Tax=Streptomyces scopuliridis TaxID=452529 RepID=UPI0036877458
MTRLRHPARPRKPVARSLDLACRLDLATREVVGYAMAGHHRASLVIDALRMAHGRAGLQPGYITHSDRGSEYTSAEFRRVISELSLRQSCGRTDHASTMPPRRVSGPCSKKRSEPGHGLTWATARAEVFAFIATFYNRRRLRKHKIFGYSPRQARRRGRPTRIYRRRRPQQWDDRGVNRPRTTHSRPRPRVSRLPACSGSVVIASEIFHG